MQIKTENMCPNEIRKAGLLMAKASEIGRDLGGYGFLSVNENSGNVFLWLDGYKDCLYISLSDDTVRVNMSCPNCGHEWDAEDSAGMPDYRAHSEEQKCPKCGEAF